MALKSDVEKKKDSNSQKQEQPTMDQERSDDFGMEFGMENSCYH